MKFKNSSGCIGLNSVYLYIGVGIYKQICRGSPSDCESVREIFYPPLAEADPAKPYSIFNLQALGKAITNLHIFTAESSADLNNNIKISFLVLPEPKSPARFVLLRVWLYWCDKSHNCNNYNIKSRTALPTRLFYIGDPDSDVLRLYYPKGKVRMKYIALSHC